MDISFYQALAQPIIQFFTAIVISGVAVTMATQILKASWIPIPAQKYPRLTAGIAAVVATVVAVATSSSQLMLNSVPQIVAFALGTLIVSAMTYNHIVKK